MTNEEAIKMLKSKLDGNTDTSYEWAECVRLSVNALEEISKKPKSNADRIRQMTDEELADKLTDKCAVCAYHNAECETKFCFCEEGVLKWLKQEVSEDAGAD